MRELRAKVEGLLLVVLICAVEHPQRLKICTLEHCGLFIVLHREKCICVYVSMCCILKNKKRRENTRRTECLCAIDGWRNQSGEHSQHSTITQRTAGCRDQERNNRRTADTEGHARSRPTQHYRRRHFGSGDSRAGGRQMKIVEIADGAELLAQDTPHG